jgi:hypothetical protein
MVVIHSVGFRYWLCQAVVVHMASIINQMLFDGTGLVTLTMKRSEVLFTSRLKHLTRKAWTSLNLATLMLFRSILKNLRTQYADATLLEFS